MGCDSPAIQKKKMKRMRSEFINERSRVLGPLKEQIKKLEEQIETNEKKLGVLTAEMQAASYAKKSDKINILSRSIFFCQAEIDALFDKLEALTNDLEAHSLIFDDKLEQMEKQWRMQ